MPVKVSMTVNGKPVTVDVESRTLLVELIREHLRLTGTHIGCDTAQCGACTVHINGAAVKSCNMLAVQAQGANVTTIKVGDRVMIEETRPLSKKKRWQLREILVKAEA